MTSVRSDISHRFSGEGNSISLANSIYDAMYLQSLFDEMQDSYERVSNITSFGFNLRWRRQLLDLLDLAPGMRVGDLMSGSGEAWQYLLPRVGEAGHIIAVDFSRQMIHRAVQRRSHLAAQNITIGHEDALDSSIECASLDVVICAYGVKTLSPAGQRQFAREISRILKPGGVFGLVEVSVPENHLLRLLYLFHLGIVVPLVGKLLLGNPDNYRMLGVFTVAFGNCYLLAEAFRSEGFKVSRHRFFWGCATALVGKRESFSI
jgi:demethylmenaquinone methyltransferase/2-methoxy-6-polyprenyl-1,4-benzoquinol methylase